MGLQIQIRSVEKLRRIWSKVRSMFRNLFIGSDQYQHYLHLLFKMVIGLVNIFVQIKLHPGLYLHEYKGGISKIQVILTCLL